MKEQYLRSLGVAEVANAEGAAIQEDKLGEEGEASAFWVRDEGLDELSRGTKEA